MIKEFKEFIQRGSVLDMAVGVVIGGAFSAIITSLVNDVIMPFIGYYTSGIDFSSLVIHLGNDTNIQIGVFINAIINFLIIAFILFLVIRSFNKMKKQEEEPEVTTKTCEFCCSEIAIKAVKCPDCTADLKVA